MIEVLNPEASAAEARVVIFDFDGTLSLIRSGWMDIMVPMCVEQLAPLGSDESREELTRVVEDFVGRLTGKETIYQMIALAEAVQARGGKPLEPLQYKRMYLARLSSYIQHRIQDLRSKRAPADRYAVPGSRPLLEYLCARGIKLYLASGTDDANVKEEAALLNLAHFFEGRIFGAQDDLNSFSKALLVQKILGQANFEPRELLVFGDGFVEIEEVKNAGGIAVGVATDEPDCLTINSWKRQRLARAGADFIISNYLELNELAGTLFDSYINAGSHNFKRKERRCAPQISTDNRMDQANRFD